MSYINFDATLWAQPIGSYTGYDLSTDSSGNKVCTLTGNIDVTGGSVPSGKTLNIAESFTLFIPFSITFTNEGTINTSAPSPGNYYGGSIWVANGGCITNNGIINNNWYSTVDGSIVNNSGTIVNNSSIYNGKGTILSNSVINNSSGTAAPPSGGTYYYPVNDVITITADFKLQAGSSFNVKSGQTLKINNNVIFTNKATITNSGTITNNGTITNTLGTILSNSVISGTGGAPSGGIYYYPGNGGTTNQIDISGNFTLPAGSSFTVKQNQTLQIINNVTFTNSDTIANNGTIVNDGTIDNTNGQILSNSVISDPSGNPAPPSPLGTYYYPDPSNNVITIISSFTLPAGSSFTVKQNQTLQINSTVIFTNNDTIVNNGTITNDGTIDNTNGKILSVNEISGTAPTDGSVGTGTYYYPDSNTGIIDITDNFTLPDSSTFNVPDGKTLNIPGGKTFTL